MLLHPMLRQISNENAPFYQLLYIRDDTIIVSVEHIHINGIIFIVNDKMFVQISANKIDVHDVVGAFGAGCWTMANNVVAKMDYHAI